MMDYQKEIENLNQWYDDIVENTETLRNDGFITEEQMEASLDSISATFRQRRLELMDDAIEQEKTLRAQKIDLAQRMAVLKERVVQNMEKHDEFTLKLPDGMSISEEAGIGFSKFNTVQNYPEGPWLTVGENEKNAASIKEVVAGIADKMRVKHEAPDSGFAVMMNEDNKRFLNIRQKLERQVDTLTTECNEAAAYNAELVIQVEQLKDANRMMWEVVEAAARYYKAQSARYHRDLGLALDAFDKAGVTR